MNKTIFLASILFFVGVIADKFNITSVNLMNTGCRSTVYPGSLVTVNWQTTNQTLASQATCYVSLRRAGNRTTLVEDNGTGSQVPCNQSNIVFNITTSPLTNTIYWNHMRIVARVTQVSPFFGHNDSCSFTVKDRAPELCPMYPCKVALIATLVPIGILAIVGCCICHQCWRKPWRVFNKSPSQEMIQPSKFLAT